MWLNGKICEGSGSDGQVLRRLGGCAGGKKQDLLGQVSDYGSYGNRYF